MIIRKRMKPLILRKYEILRTRLKRDFTGFQQIEREYGKYLKGYMGEVKVDYYLQFLEPMSTILQDVCLKVDGTSVQLDNIIISQHAIYIVEVKNYSGTIIFDTALNQFIRDDSRKETGFSHPIAQTELQKLKLQNWLHHHGFANIPIYTFIAISEPSTVIKVLGDTEPIAKVAVHGERIPHIILNIEKQLEHTNKFMHQKIGHAIARKCIDFDKEIIKEHGIKREDIMNGVKCTNCNMLGMKRIPKSWQCPKCNHKDQRAHYQTINEYLFLFPWITNKECKNFLQVDSRHMVSKTLKNANLTYDPTHKRWMAIRK
ncbi:nuclease-related domain-containing protein [Oceanobacillus sp. FSL K6-2867]|uniref:nuclease-related domain-containing protein n=1 Tax=Oceanobacillus sp. FSL K6-2867 TaxID=2954748 RepID=UPI0030D9557F